MSRAKYAAASGFDCWGDKALWRLLTDSGVTPLIPEDAI